jgi:hypothetical protein
MYNALAFFQFDEIEEGHVMELWQNICASTYFSKYRMHRA